MSRVRAFLRRHRRIGLDTSIFIYHIESHPSFGLVTREIFQWIEIKGTAITSTITLTELLVRPYRDRDDRLVAQCIGLLTSYPNLEWQAPELDIANAAARLRAEGNLRTPDALQVATAIRRGATGFLTNDSALRRVAGVEIGVIGEM